MLAECLNNGDLFRFLVDFRYMKMGTLYREIATGLAALAMTYF